VIARILSRAQAQAGFGLIELILAMLVLTIALFALVASFTAGAVALRRAATVSTATALANSQLELYRATTFDQIGLNTDAVDTSDATYQSEPGWDNQVTDASCDTDLPACVPSRTAVAADGKSYRVDTYVTWLTPSGGGRDVKRVVVVIRNPATTGSASIARHGSTFERATG